MFSKIHKLLGDSSSHSSFKSKYILLFYKYHSGLSNFKAPISSKVTLQGQTNKQNSFIIIKS